MKKIESFRFWINDYITSTVRRRCSLEARGLYFDILMVLYRSPRPGYACENVGGSLVYLGREEILNDAGSPRAARLFDDLAKWGGLVYDDECGGWYNPKAVAVAEKERDFREKKVNAGRLGGKAKARKVAVLKQTSSSATDLSVAESCPPDPDSEPEPDPNPEPEPDAHSAPARDKNADLEQVIQAWREAFDAPNYRPDMWDTIAINDAFAANWTVEMLCESVTGWANDPWKERKQHCSIPKLLKDSAQIQKGIALGEKKEDSGDDGRGQHEVPEIEKAGQRPLWAEILEDDPDAVVPDWYREEMGG